MRNRMHRVVVEVAERELSPLNVPLTEWEVLHTWETFYEGKLPLFRYAQKEFGVCTHVEDCAYFFLSKEEDGRWWQTRVKVVEGAKRKETFTLV